MTCCIVYPDQLNRLKGVEILILLKLQPIWHEPFDFPSEISMLMVNTPNLTYFYVYVLYCFQENPLMASLHLGTVM